MRLTSFTLQLSLRPTARNESVLGFQGEVGAECRSLRRTRHPEMKVKSLGQSMSWSHGMKVMGTGTVRGGGYWHL